MLSLLSILFPSFPCSPQLCGYYQFRKIIRYSLWILFTYSIKCSITLRRGSTCTIEFECWSLPCCLARFDRPWCGRNGNSRWFGQCSILSFYESRRGRCIVTFCCIGRCKCTRRSDKWLSIREAITTAGCSDFDTRL